MSARISKMYKDSGGCNTEHKCKECRYFADSGIKNEYVCKRQVSEDRWDGEWMSCKYFEDRGDEPMEAIKKDGLVIDPEFSKLIKPLTDEEYKQLEQNCIQYGIQDAIKIWNGIIVDGHNRYAIAKKNGLSYKTISMSFESREEAKYWIRCNQLGRRNLEKWERFDLVKENREYEAKQSEKNLHKATGGDRKSEKYKEEQEKAKSTRNNHPGKNQGGVIFHYLDDEKGNEAPPVKTVKQIKQAEHNKNRTSAKQAKQVGVSARTYDKMEYIDKHGTPEINELVRKGTITTERAYQDTKAKMNPAPPKPTPMSEHRKYEKKKAEGNGPVDLKDARKDKSNIKLIHLDFWKRFGVIRSSIKKIHNESEVGHIDLGEAEKYLDEKQLKELRSSISESINLLMDFLKELGNER